ncbi:MAG: hypothetical protein U0T85_04945 [Cloacibacterium normanense]
MIERKLFKISAVRAGIELNTAKEETWVSIAQKNMNLEIISHHFSQKPIWESAMIYL